MGYLSVLHNVIISESDLQRLAGQKRKRMMGFGVLLLLDFSFVED
jgi:hypothetical protein